MRPNTIKSSRRISQVFAEGKRKSNRFCTVIAANHPDMMDGESAFEHGRQGRVAFIAGKRNGNACWRNAAKRRLREVARQLGGPWSGYDVLLVAKRSICEAPYAEVLAALKETIDKSYLGKGHAG